MAEHGPMLEPYTLAAPPWRPSMHTDVSLGYPGIWAPTQAEELTSQAVRSGVTFVPPVLNESTSVQEQIYERLSRPGSIHLLNTLVNGVRDVRRARRAADITAHEFRLPPRVTLNDGKLAAYVRALSDPLVPLAHLARGLPYGFRGMKLLDMLWQGPQPEVGVASWRQNYTGQGIPIPRAMWFIHAIGACEVQTQKCSAVHYTEDWTAAVLAWLTQQLDVLPHDEAAEQGAIPGVQDASVVHWTNKWSYALALVQAMRSDSLLADDAYLRWVVTQLHASQGCTRACMLQIVCTVYKDLLARACLGVNLIAALSTPHTSPTRAWFAEQEASLLRRCYETEPRAFVGMHLWTPTSRLPVLLGTLEAPFYPPEAAQSRLLEGALAPLLASSRTDSAVAWDAVAIHLLDTGEQDTTTLFLRYFLPPGMLPDVERRVSLLLTWACTLDRDYPGRVYIAVELVRLFDACQNNRLVLHDGRHVAWPAQRYALFDTIARWIDTIESADAPAHANAELGALSLPSVARLLGALCSANLFSFVRFFQRLQLRGTVCLETDAPRTQRTRTHIHARIFCSMPIHHVSDTVVQQRRVAIYGQCAAQSYEEATEQRAFREVSQTFPWLCHALPEEEHIASPASAPPPSPAAMAPPDMPALPASPSFPDNASPVLDALQLRQKVPYLLSASPYVQDRIAQRIGPVLTSETARAPTADEFCEIASMLCAIEALSTLANLCLALLDRHVEPSCVVSVCHILAAHSRTWDALRITDALAAHVAPHAVHDSSAPGTSVRVVHSRGRSMAVASARGALNAMGRGDLEEKLMPARPVHATMLAAAHAPSRALLCGTSGEALDAACAALLATVPLDDAPNALWQHALDMASAPDAQPFSPAIVACIAAVAGAAGVRLAVRDWIRKRYALDGGAAAPASTAWCALVAGMVRFGHLELDSLLHTLSDFVAEHRDATTHMFWSACVALSDTLFCAHSSSACGIATVGVATWHDLVLQRDMLVRRNALMPWVLAVRHAPSLAARLAPHAEWLRLQWRTHPGAFLHGTDAASEHVLRAAHVWSASVLLRHGTPDQIADALERVSPCDAAWSLAELRLVLDTVEPARLAELVESLMPCLLPAPAALQGARDELLFGFGAQRMVHDALASTALRRWVAAPDEEQGAVYIHAMVRLAHAWRGELYCDEAILLDALRALDKALDAAHEPLAVLLFVLRCDAWRANGVFSQALRAALLQLLPRLLRLCEEAGGAMAELLEACTVQVELAVGAEALAAWLPTAPHVPPRLQRLVEHASLPLHAWQRFDALGNPPPPPTRDPWAVPLENCGALPLEVCDTCKTRDGVPNTGERSAPPLWLTSEQTYGDMDNMPLGAQTIAMA
ncbi:Srb8p [Malassezia vespertilionis]|uniref:Mediator of RNA polymerase II transcription subunit 12 n=1 Tax=Malassezia vespertilionis TaxID=2020962 RepID=A0A2N1JA29_9BASI|nr:Srb8p [Malassezia vespertilionis]